MKQPRFKNNYNAHLFVEDHETNTIVDQETGETKQMPSKTLPNRSLSVKQILERYAKGLPITGNNNVPIYYGEDIQMPDLDKLDLSERHEILMQARERVKAIQAELNKRTNEERYKQLEIQWQRNQDKLKELEEKPTPKNDQPKE